VCMATQHAGVSRPYGMYQPHEIRSSFRGLRHAGAVARAGPPIHRAVPTTACTSRRDAIAAAGQAHRGAAAVRHAAKHPEFRDPHRACHFDLIHVVECKPVIRRCPPASGRVGDGFRHALAASCSSTAGQFRDLGLTDATMAHSSLMEVSMLYLLSCRRGTMPIWVRIHARF